MKKVVIIRNIYTRTKRVYVSCMHLLASNIFVHKYLCLNNEKIKFLFTGFQPWCRPHLFLFHSDAKIISSY